MADAIMRPPQRAVSFNAGDKVEVCGYEQGFMGSYFEATVVALLSDGRYQIQYKNLIEDEVTKKPLNETVFPKDLRPRAPWLRTNGGFRRNQSVDAFDNDGWWHGRIDGVHVDSLVGRYDVYFSSTNEVVTYRAGLIRLHHDFIDGEWVVGSNESN